MTDPAVAVSVVVPVFDGAATIGAQLEALAAAQVAGVACEVVVADNGSRDGTVAIARSYADRLPVTVVDASHRQGANAARTVGVQASRGARLLFCDADDEVDPSWIERMSSALDAGHELVAGVIDYTRLNAPDVVAWRGAPRAGVIPMMGFLPGAHLANLAMTRALYERLGGFDDAYTGGDDIEFVWRAQLDGVALHEARDAIVHYRLRPTLRAHWRQCVGYGACEPHLYRKYASAGMPRRPASALLRDLWWLATRLPFAWSRARFGAWLRRAGQQWGRFTGAVRYRTPWW